MTASEHLNQDTGCGRLTTKTTLVITVVFLDQPFLRELTTVLLLYSTIFIL
jgi:hypothetical protein